MEARRWSNARSLRQFEQWQATGKIPLEHDETLSATQLANEYIMLRLRTSDGLDLGTLRQRYRTDLRTIKGKDLADMAAQRLIEADYKDRIQLTRDGFLICDAVTERLLI